MPASRFPELREDGSLGALLRGIENGDTRKAAAGRVGIPTRTVNQWLEYGSAALEKEHAGGELSETERGYADFVLELEAAMDRGEANLMDKATGMAERGDPNWKWYAQVLERTRRDGWGRSEKVELGGGGIQIVVSGRPERQLDGSGGAVLEADGQRALPADTAAAGVPE
jgi:hypothetical protein